MGGPRWKREVFPDHKFDFIDINSFKAHGLLLWAGYLWVFIDILKSVAVYVLDTQTAIFLLAFNKWATQVQPAIPMSISRWIFSGCIIFSFLLLAKDWWTAKKIIRSRDISFAYTNLIANRWYSVRGGYAYYCLFDKLGESRHAWDSIAFFVFFTFKGWKRLVLAEGPRQVLNAITLYSVAKDQDFSFDVHRYQKEFTTIQGVVMSFMLLTVAIWALSFIRLLVAAILYWPLLVCHIRGNLKEYCCHKVDKRITQILVDRRRRRNDTFKLEKSRDVGTVTPDLGKFQPTLPKVELDDDGGSVISMPLYPLSRSDTGDSRRGLLSRQDTTSSNPYLQRTDTGMTTNSNISRQNTNPAIARTDTSLSRTPSRPATATTIDSRPLTRAESNGPQQRGGPPRQPTLPHLVGDFSIPELPRPATTRSDSRSGHSSTPRPSTATTTTSTPPSSSGPPPSRGPSNPSSRDPSVAGRNFGPLPRSNTAGPTGQYRMPVRSNTAQTMDSGFRPPPRSNTNPYVNAAGGGRDITGSRRQERPFSPSEERYGRGGYR